MTEKERCFSKMSYGTKTLAEVAAGEARQYSGNKNIKPYKCKLYDHWHIGHSYD